MDIPALGLFQFTGLTALNSLLKNLPTGLAPVESGLCTTPFQLDSEVVQSPASHQG